MENCRKVSLFSFFSLFFFVGFSQPIVTSFSPQAAAAGSTVVLSGSNFSPVASSNIVFFGAVKATVTASTSTSVSVLVPSGASCKPIAVATGNLVGYSKLPFILTFPHSSVGFKSTSLLKRSNISPGGSSAEADIDNDGKIDIINIDNSLNSSLLISRNTSSGGNFSFAQSVGFPCIQYSDLPIVADLNGDGKLDVVLVNHLDSSVSIFQNTSLPGAVSFAARVDIHIHQYISGLTAGDVDGDGRTDLAVNSNALFCILRNIGNGGAIAFDIPMIVASNNPRDIKIGDIDGDAKNDITVTNVTLNTISVFRNIGTAGTISFAPEVSIPTYGSPEYFILNDIDGDGKLDIVHTSTTIRGIVLLKNSSTAGTIAFATKINFITADAPQYIAAGDLDGDGKADIAVGDGYYDNLSVFINNATPGADFNAATLLAPVVFTIGSTGGIRVAMADLNGDNKPEIVGSGIFENRLDQPFIASLSPASAAPGKVVTLTGSEFSGVTAVSFGGVPAASFNVVSDTKLTATVGNGASGSVTATNTYGTGSLAGFTYTPLPVIDSVRPLTGANGTIITIKGSNFNLSNDTVLVGGTKAAINSITTTTITATVGNGSSGAITLKDARGSVSYYGFTYTGPVPPPVITSLTPGDIIKQGTQVIITGNNFNGATAVKFGGMNAASFTVNSDTVITATAGGGSSGKVYVTTTVGTDSFSVPLVYYPTPQLSSITPSAATSGTVVSIAGTGLAGATAVSVGGVAVASFTVYSPTSIQAILGQATSGSVSVTTPGGTVTGLSFTALATPVISSFAPLAAPAGSTVTISGSNFSNNAGNNIVYFGGVAAVVTSASSTALVVQVPYGASYSPISVTVNNKTAYSSKPFTATFAPASGKFSYQSFFKDTLMPQGTDQNVVATGDLDGDGKADLAVAVGGASVLSVFRNTSTILKTSFAARQDYTIADPSLGIAMTDFDGDGKPDLAVASGNSYVISFFRNVSTQGNIQFSKTTFNTNCWYLAAADMDNDGKPDLIVTEFSGLTTVYRNESVQGNISFSLQDKYVLSNSIKSITAFDINGDGKADIAGTSGNSVLVFKNMSTPGNILLPLQFTLATSYSAVGVALGDIDGDDKTDIAVSSSVGNSTGLGFLSFFRNIGSSGSFNFSSRLDYSLSVSPAGVYIADLTGDGKPDFLVAAAGAPFVVKNISTSGNIMVDLSNRFILPTFTWSNRNMALQDLQNDGKPDIIFPALGIYRNRVNEPTITGFSPGNGAIGDTITLTGINFTGATSVTFGDTAAASYNVVSDSVIKAVLGVGTSGTIKVVAALGYGTISGFSFTSPEIISFSPMITGRDSTVRIKGNNFYHVSAVSFGGVPAKSFTSNNSDLINAVVGIGSSGLVSVTNTYGIGTKPGFIFVDTPLLHTFSPDTAAIGDTIIVTGSKLSATSAVTFGRVVAASYIVVSDTLIKVIVGAGATGYLTVFTAGGRDSLPGFVYTSPVISHFLPFQAGAGAPVTISGKYFSGATAVAFGGVAATSFTIVSDSIIIATVASGSSGNVSVTSPKGTGVKAGFIYTTTIPQISFLTPGTAPVGSIVNIEGSNFSPSLSGNTVRFGAVKALIISATTSTLSVMVPAGATYEPVSVTVNGLTCYSPFAFNTTFSGAAAGFTAYSFATMIDSSLESSPSALGIDDFDDDGKPDIAASSSSYKVVAFAKNKSHYPSVAVDTAVAFHSLYQMFDVSFADMDGDGKRDILIANESDYFACSVIKNTSSPSLLSVGARSDITSYTLGARGAASADLDLDGKPDIGVISGVNTKLFILLKNTTSAGTISFGPQIVNNINEQPESVKFADFDGDGKPDAVVGTLSYVSIYKNLTTAGNLQMSPRRIFSTGGMPYRVVIADMDGDNKPDIVAANLSTNTVSVLRNTSTYDSISFVNTNFTAGGGYITGITVGDLDGDGKPDIATCNNNATMCVLKNISAAGNIALSNSVVYPGSGTQTAIAIADLDRDGKPDIMVSKVGTPSLSIYRNTVVSNIVKGAVFLDKNYNGVKDGNDVVFNDARITAKQAGDSLTTITSNGVFSLNSDTGTVVTTATPYLPYYNVVPASHTSVFTSYYNTDSTWFAMQPIPGKKDIAVTLIPLTSLRGGFYANYKILYKNKGTDVVTSGYVELIKSSQFSLTSASPAYTSANADTIRWNFTNLNPGDTAGIIVGFNVNPPPGVNLGDTIRTTVSVYPVASDLVPADNTSSLLQTVIGSYDPNSKEESHGGIVKSATLINGEYATYIIRFQNVGSDTAFNIIVKDTLSDKLDWGTFEMITASHNYSLYIDKQNNCTWHFSNILLPQSTVNEPASHGYIVYRIKLKPSLAVGDTVVNTAGIYFDYNLPISTNTVETVIQGTVFPLTLQHFDAQKNGSNNLLKWSVAGQQDASYFVVEKSANAINFEKLGEVNSLINSLPVDYSFVHQHPKKMMNYYRLKIVAGSGKISYSNIRQVDNTAELDFTIYPNPVKNKLTINFNSQTKKTGKIEIINLEGKILFSKTISVDRNFSSQNLNLDWLSTGSYFARLSFDGHQDAVKFQKL